MQPAVLAVFGIETVWRRRGGRRGTQPAPPLQEVAGVLRVRGPWQSAEQAPALVHAMVQSLQLDPVVRIDWEPETGPVQEPVATDAQPLLWFGSEAGGLTPPALWAGLPAPDCLRAAAARRAAWEVLAPFKRALRARGLLLVPRA